METIPYRNTKLLVKTIPKNTLLFRIVDRPEDDLRGVKLEDGTRCLTPNYNVFFYPNPFMGSFALDTHLQKSQNTLHVYKLKNDVKVLSLISPSKYSRRTKNEKGMFVRRCSTVKRGCLPRSGTEYDPCLSDAILKKHPEIVGIISIAMTDNARAKRRLGKTSKLKKYFKNATDSRGISGVPELMLHPLTKRPSTNLITNESDVLENNYERILSFNRFETTQMEKFMNEHAVYNSDTYFFDFRE